jgi:hypothetical protein
MADIVADVKRWVTQNFFRKIDGTATSTGAQDAGRPLVLDATGKIDRSAYGSELDADGPIVAIYGKRYRIGIQPLSGITAIFSYDNTGAAYIPLVIDGQTIKLRPNADSTKSVDIDSSGNVTLHGTIKTPLDVTWDMGDYTAGAPAATGYVTVKIGGVTYKLLAST